VQGAAFIALVGTLTVIPTIPVAGMALLLGIDRFMSMFRAMVNMLGNGVATLVVARWEKEIDGKTLAKNSGVASAASCRLRTGESRVNGFVMNFNFVVPGAGVEPARPGGQGILSSSGVRVSILINSLLHF